MERAETIKPGINTVTDTRGMTCSFCGGTVYSSLQLGEDRFVCGECLFNKLKEPEFFYIEDMDGSRIVKKKLNDVHWSAVEEDYDGGHWGAGNGE